MDRSPLAFRQVVASIDHTAKSVKHPAEQVFPHGNPQRIANIAHHRPTAQTASGGQRNPSNDPLIEMADNLDDNLLKWQPSLSVVAYQVLAVVSVVGNTALRFLTTTDLAEKKGIGK